LAERVSAPISAAIARRYFNDFIILRVDLMLLSKEQSSGHSPTKFLGKP